MKLGKFFSKNTNKILLSLSFLLLFMMILIRIFVSKSFFCSEITECLLFLNSIFANIFPLILIYLLGAFYSGKNTLQKSKKVKKKPKKYLFHMKENVMENIIKIIIIFMAIFIFSVILFLVISPFLSIDEVLQEKISIFLFIISFAFLFLFFIFVFFIASKTKIIPTTDPKVKEKLQKKMKAEIFSLHFTSFDEMTSNIEKNFSRNHYQKYVISNLSCKENFIYIKQREFFRIECIFVIHLQELNKEVIHELDKKVAHFVYGKFSRIDFLEIRNILWVDVENTYFHWYMNNGVVQPFRTCSLFVGILPNKKQIYLTKNRNGLYPSLYKKMTMSILHLFSLK